MTLGRLRKQYLLSSEDLFGRASHLDLIFVNISEGPKVLVKGNAKLMREAAANEVLAKVVFGLDKERVAGPNGS